MIGPRDLFRTREASVTICGIVVLANRLLAGDYSRPKVFISSGERSEYFLPTTFHTEAIDNILEYRPTQSDLSKHDQDAQINERSSCRVRAVPIGTTFRIQPEMPQGLSRVN